MSSASSVQPTRYETVWETFRFGQRTCDQFISLDWDMKRTVVRINVAFMGGIALEPLRFDTQRNIAIGVYEPGWRTWLYVNERPGLDPEKDPQFYFDLVLRLLDEQGLTP